MNKQELIKNIRKLSVYGRDLIEIDEALNLVNKLDEPGKVTIPQFVAGWIKYCKFTGVNLYHALEMGDLHFYNYANQKDYSKLKEFFEVKGNQELFARAYLDGYLVEKEPKYTVRMKGIIGYTTHLNKNLDSQNWFFASKNEADGYRVKHTREELGDAGFSWVFDCEGVEVEEVTE